MIQPAPLTRRPPIFRSIEAHIESVAIGDLQMFEITSHDHPGMRPGDIIFVDSTPLDQVDDKTRLLIEYNGTYILRQKQFVQAILRRSGLHVVGQEKRETIKFIGRLICWLHARRL